jgi:hypothetical protein
MALPTSGAYIYANASHIELDSVAPYGYGAANGYITAGIMDFSIPAASYTSGSITINAYNLTHGHATRSYTLYPSTRTGSLTDVDYFSCVTTTPLSSPVPETSLGPASVFTLNSAGLSYFSSGGTKPVCLLESNFGLNKVSYPSSVGMPPDDNDYIYFGTSAGGMAPTINLVSSPVPCTKTASISLLSGLWYINNYYSIPVNYNCYNDTTHCPISFGVGIIPANYSDYEAFYTTAKTSNYNASNSITGFTDLNLSRNYYGKGIFEIGMLTPTSSTIGYITITDSQLNAALCRPTSSPLSFLVDFKLINTKATTSKPWCDTATICSGISTTSNVFSLQGIVNGLNCTGRELLCYAFFPTPDSINDLQNEFILASTRFPLSPFTALYSDLQSSATGTQKIAPGTINIPRYNSSTHVFDTFITATISPPATANYIYSKFKRWEDYAMWALLGIIPIIGILLIIIL